MVDTSPLIGETRDHVRRLLASDSTGHDWWHVHRVWQMARRIAQEEEADMEIVELAALLHDVADWKFHNGDETAGPREVRAWLEHHQVDPIVIERVCRIVAEVSFKGAGVSTVPTTLEGKVVQDADRLDALGAIGIARAFAYGGHKNRRMHDPGEPPTVHESFEHYKAGTGTTINHFHEKLLLLKDRMHTATARRIATERHEYMLHFLRRFHHEWEGDQ